MIQIYIN